MENAETDCREIVRRIYPYVDGEIDGVECAEIERHLSACADCLGHVDFERDLKEIVRRKCAGQEIPSGMTERLRERLRSFLEER